MGQGMVTELLAERVRQLRTRLGWSAQQLADECARAGYPALIRGTIAKIESGSRKSVTAEEIAVLAYVLRTTPNELLATPDWQLGPDTAPPGHSRLHLAIQVEHDGIDANRFILSSWRQEDELAWPPPRREIQGVAGDSLEREIDDLVLSAERAWSNHPGQVALEFVLPRSLLHLPVHQWVKDGDRPLALDYLISVRSLERMRSSHLHRVWRNRWMSLRRDPSPDRIYFTAPDELERVDVVLNDDRWLAVVLNEPPPSQPGTRRVDEFTSAMRSGIPALIWHPNRSADALRDVVDALVEHNGLADLPTRTRAARLSAYGTGATFDDITRDLVLLWDDADRILPMDTLPSPLVGV